MKNFNILKKLALTALIFTAMAVNLQSEGSWIDKGTYFEQSAKTAKIIFIRYSEDGSYILTLDTDGILTKWETKTGEIIQQKNIPEFHYFIGFTEYDYFELSHDEKYALISRFFRDSTFSYRAVVDKYDIDNDSLLFRIKLNIGQFFGQKLQNRPPAYAFGCETKAKFSPDDKTIVCIVNLELENSMYSSTGMIGMWDAEKSRPLNYPITGYTRAMAVTNDIRDFACSYTIGYVQNYGYSIYKTKLFFGDTLTYEDGSNYSIDKLFFKDEGKKLIGVGKIETDSGDYVFEWDTGTKELISKTEFDIKDSVKLGYFIRTFTPSFDGNFIVFDNLDKLYVLRYPGGEVSEGLDIPAYKNGRIFSHNPSEYEVAFADDDGLLRIAKYEAPVSDVNDNSLRKMPEVKLAPNPADDHAYLYFNPEKPVHLNVKIYSSIGQELAEITNRELESSPASVVIRPKEYGLTPGVYYLRIQFGDSIVTKALYIK